MKHSIYIDDENGLLLISLIGRCSNQEIKLLGERVKWIPPRKCSKAILDISELASFPDQEGQDLLIQLMGNIGVKKVALVGSRPEVKMVGVVFMDSLNKYMKTAFFQTADKAKLWLDEISMN